METHAYILAVDLGTSGPKVGLATTGGQMLGYEFEPVELLLYEGGPAEQAPRPWWQAICAASRRLLVRFPEAPDRLAAVNCTAQWAGTVPVDREGQPLMNAIIWLDSRGGTVHQTPGGGLVERSRLRPVEARCTGFACLAHLPRSRAKTPLAMSCLSVTSGPTSTGFYKFLEPLDFLNLRLTGRFAASYDSIGQYFATDNRRLDHVCYDEKLLAISTIRRSHLPEPAARLPACSAS